MQSNLNDFWGTPQEEPTPVSGAVENDDLDINSPCPMCFRSDHTVSSKGDSKDKIDVVCTECNISYTFYHEGIWQLIGI